MMAVWNDQKKTDSCPFCHQKAIPTAILPSKAVPTDILPSKAVPMTVFPSKLSIFSQLCQSDWPHCQISCSIDLSIHSSLPLPHKSCYVLSHALLLFFISNPYCWLMADMLFQHSFFYLSLYDTLPQCSLVCWLMDKHDSYYYLMHSHFQIVYKLTYPVLVW